MSNTSVTSIISLPSVTDLDECYTNLIEQLNDYINEKCTDPAEKNICRKWLKVFNNVADSEKVARNCFMVLMLEQLETYYTISSPFTDINNLEIKLDELLANYSNESLSNYDFNKTPEAMEQNDEAQRQAAGFQSANEVNFEMKCSQEKQKCEENVRLQAQLQKLHMEYTLAQTKAAQLRLKIDQVKLFQKGLPNNAIELLIKDIISESLHNYLQKMQRDNDDADSSDVSKNSLPIKIFENCFADLSKDDQRFYDAIRICDIEFDVILNSCFHNEFKNRLETLILTANRKLEKAKNNVQTKYAERLNFNSWSNELQLKLVRMKCFSALRNIFIKDRTGTATNMQDILNLLEQNCQDIFEELY